MKQRNLVFVISFLTVCNIVFCQQSGNVVAENKAQVVSQPAQQQETKPAQGSETTQVKQIEQVSQPAKETEKKEIIPAEKEKFSGEEIVEEGSPIEQMFSRSVSLQVSKRLRQFGYDMFKLPSTTFAPVEDMPVGPDYIVGPGDSLNIYMSGIVNKVVSVTVDREGKIVLPESGTLFVWGLPFSKVEKLIKSVLSETFANVQVDVSMGRLRTIRVFVLGEVTKPGSYTLSSLATLFQALYEAGGPTKLGTLRKIRLLRGNEVVDVVDLYKFLLEGQKTQDYRLFSNDVIFVPPIGPVGAIAGYVKRPGIYELSGKTKISDLITIAGGMIPTAYINRLQVERIKEHEKRILLDLEFKDVSELEHSTNNLVLQDGDLVLIYPILPYKRGWVAIEGNVTRPGEYQFIEGMRISDLLKKAEGVLPEFYERAEILRFVSEHTRQPIAFNLEKVLKGDKNEDLPLKEWDIVKIYSLYDIYPEPIVEIRGNVHKPGAYRFIEGMKVSDLLFRGENPTAEAYLERAELYRFRKDKTREMKVINLKEILDGKKEADITLEPWDKLVVYSLYDIFPTGYVGVEGAVQKPGNYELTQGMKISDLLFQAGYPLKEAYLERAELYRFRKDKTREMIPINLNKVLSGDEKENMALEEKDMLKIYTISEVIPKSYVEISGAVYEPGRYELTTNMKISDLIFQAKGLKKFASQVAELYRQRPGDTPEVIKLDITRDDIALHEDDHLFIRYETEWIEKNKITISGEVVRPGEYVIQKGETLTDILKRAGGFTDKAYLPAAIFTRQSVKELQKKHMMEFIEMEQRKILEEESSLTALNLTEAERKQRMDSLQYRKGILESLSRVDVPGRIIVNLPKILEGHEKFFVEDGDTLHIPQIPSSVQIIGAVYNPGAIFYEPGKDVNYYLAKVGGPTNQANTKEIYVIRASGEVVSDIKKFGTRIERGDTIVVPQQYTFKTPAGILLRDIAQVFYNFALPVAAIIK